MGPLRAALIALLLAGCAAAPSRPPGATRNVVVFIADDMGYGDLSCYGHPVLRTPNLDRLAAEGMRFDAAFLTISSCSPSRASILTGRYPHATGAPDLHQPLPAGQRTVARALGELGWHRAAVGKWHLGDAEKRNWDRIHEVGGAETAAAARRVLAERPKERPFFLWIATWDPHRPYDEPQPAPHDPAKVVLPPYLPDHPKIRAELAKYYDEIARLDRHVGEIRAALEAEGELDRTLIVFLSDNGMPFPRAKTTLYDSGIRTPFIARAPGLVPAGSVQKGLASVVDLAPTILELAGAAPGPVQGRSLLPMLRDPGARTRDAVFAEANWHDYAQFTRSVRTDRWLLIRNYYWDVPLWNSVDSIDAPTWEGVLELRKAGKLTPAQDFLFTSPRPFEELYDLAADPHSLESVVDRPEHRAVLAGLRTRLDNWRVESVDVMPAERTPDGWTREGIPLPHNQPWYDRWKKSGKNTLDRF
jgi:arylsulfatase A-like enzyme